MHVNFKINARGFNKIFCLGKTDWILASIVSLIIGIISFLLISVINVCVNQALVFDLNEKISRCDQVSLTLKESMGQLPLSEIKSKLAQLRSSFFFQVYQEKDGLDEEITYPIIVDRQGYSLEGKFKNIPNDHLKNSKSIYLYRNNVVLIYPLLQREPILYLIIPLKASRRVNMSLNDNGLGLKAVYDPFWVLQENALLLISLMVVGGTISFIFKAWLVKRRRSRFWSRSRNIIGKSLLIKKNLEISKKSVYNLRSTTSEIRKNLLNFAARYLDIFGNLLKLIGGSNFRSLNKEQAKSQQITVFDPFSKRKHLFKQILQEAINVFSDEIEVRRVTYTIEETNKGIIMNDYDFVFSLLLKSLEAVIKLAPISCNIKITSAVKEGELNLCFSGNFKSSLESSHYPTYIKHEIYKKKDTTFLKVAIQDLAKFNNTKGQENDNIIPLFVK
ncbi:hypothetical protein [Candidatus Odyssella thessalonicensis]|uniref:hypothetical protein n=1 Tax=Candidatus Odyssella thessalonicensis TaxID=84647 RepID=UPI000225B960|nr:hypothetical protein [Candidatus Odyssella thessalonicensis]